MAINVAIEDLPEKDSLTSGDMFVMQRGEQNFKVDIKNIGGGLFKATRMLSAAELQALNTTPISIIPSPGSGNYIHMVAVTAFRNGTAFTATDAILKMVYSGATQSIMASAAGFLTRVAASTADVFTQTTGAGQQLISASGISAYLTADVTTATGPVTVEIIYRVTNFS